MVKVLDERPSVILRAKRDEVLEIAARFGVTNVRVFGSIARGDDTVQSDVDFIVSFKPGTMSLGDFVALEDELSSLLGVPVDVVSASANRSQSVLSQAIEL